MKAEIYEQARVVAKKMRKLQDRRECLKVLHNAMYQPPEIITAKVIIKTKPGFKSKFDLLNDLYFPVEFNNLIQSELMEIDKKIEELAGEFDSI